MLQGTAERRKEQGERRATGAFERVTHTSHSAAKTSHTDEKRTLPSRMKPVRSDLFQNGCGLGPKRTVPSRLTNKLPPIGKSVDGEGQKVGKGNNASQGKLTLQPMAGKQRKQASTSPHSRVSALLSKSLHAHKVPVPIAKSLQMRRNLSMDLEDFEEKFSRPKVTANCLLNTFSDGLTQYTETWPGGENRTSRRGELENAYREAGTHECLTLRPSAAHPPVYCSCPALLYRQRNLHYRQLFSKKGPAKPLASLFPIYIDKYPGIHLKATLIIYFDGVLGDCYKRCLTDTSPKSIRLRKHSILGLQWLQQTFNLVFATSIGRARAVRIVNYFRKAKVSFLAAYRIVGETISVVDYTKVVEDLGINPSTTLVVASLDLAYEDLAQVSEESLYMKAGTKIKLLANGIPTGPVVSLLVPSLKAQINAEMLSFDLVAGAIQHLRKTHSWDSDFRRMQTHPHPDFHPISTSLVHEVALHHTLTFPRADSVRKGLPQSCCTLHHTPIWPDDLSIPLNSVIVLTLRPTPGARGGCDLMESKALRVKSGFLNLLDYTTIGSTPRGGKQRADESV